MTGRPDLIAAATVGTAHRSVDLDELADALRPEPLPADRATALLDAAVLSALASRTVPPMMAPPAAAPVAPAPELRPVVPAVVTQVLSRVRDHPGVLVEALTLIDRAGRRLPPELVPELLDDKRSDVAAHTRPVAGEIGRLLTAKNPRWASPPEPDPSDRRDWDDGTLATRAAWLRAVRRSDSDAAREVLMQGWSRETAAHRAEFLTVLADGLSAADEEFLMTAVSDRSRAVSATALNLLTLLPTSRLRADLRRWAATMVRVRQRWLSTTVTVEAPVTADLTVWPFPENDPAEAVISRTDPADWPQIFDADLLPLIAGRTEALRPLRAGFRRAAITFRHAGLANALITAGAGDRDPKTPPLVDDALWSLLSPDGAAAQLDRLLTTPHRRHDQVAAAMASIRAPWSRSTVARLAEWLPAGGPSGEPAPRTLWERWATATALADCRAAAELARGMIAGATGDSAAALTTRASNAANLLTLRAVLHETLSPPGGHP